MKDKAKLRQQMWDWLEQASVARVPTAQGRVPNFARPEETAQTVKCNPVNPQVQDFIRRGLGELVLPASVPTTERLEKSALLALAAEWKERLGVQVKRVQLRAMRNKWGSVSTAGNLTLARDLVKLPRRLVEYVICHELLHLRVPTHNRLYRLLLSRHIPDWRCREQELGRRVLALGEGGE